MDSRQASFSMMAAVMGAAAELDRTEAAYRTRRGQEGKALACRPTGGKAYGYRSTVLPDGAKALAIVEAEAKIVRRIFREYAAGTSPREIAARLNSDGIPSPGASWNRNGSGQGKRSDGKWQSTAIHGHALRGTGILNNPRYAGRIEWGRTRWKRGHANSLKRKPIQEAAPFHSYTDESQRIVPQGLWDAVKARQALVHLGSASIRATRRTQRGRPALHLLSGLFTCNTCGGSFGIVDARNYGCMTLKNGGPAACSNDAKIRRDELEQRIPDMIRDDLLSGEAVALATKEIGRVLREARKATPSAPVTDQAVAAKDREVEELRNLMRGGVLSPTVGQAALNRATQERSDLISAREQKDTRSTDRVVRLIPDLARQYRKVIDELPRQDLPPDELTRARGLIHRFIGGPATVEKDDAGRVLVRLTLDGRPLLGASGQNVSNLVAGAGFEPATFGL
ncbi:MAG: recombinase family protein [Steroidobacteraceae bacterium]|nr:recombinase family protein [Steroidobacteraceae bacterium]MBP7013153.1 recombinase family protein [Steroidobacteraceae bacterium]